MHRLGLIVLALCLLGTAPCDDRPPLPPPPGCSELVCTCEEGFELRGGICFDIDECVNSAACDENADCENTAGSFTCTCLEGYVAVGSDCVIDEPCSGSADCNANASC